MTIPMLRPLALLLAAAPLAACDRTAEPRGEVAADAAAPGGNAAAPTPIPTPAPSASATPGADTLALEGLGDLRIGAPVPTGSSFASRGAQASDTCRTLSSPRYPGVYAIVEGNVVRRISVGGASRVKLVEGIGVGTPEAEARAAFPGFRAEPHKYVAAPAGYLTAPGLKDGDAGLRFEIGGDRRVSLIHVGIMPTLAYVEGCS